MTAQGKNSHMLAKRPDDSYLNMVERLAYLQGKDKREALLAYGLDEEAADTFLEIKAAYDRAIEAAEYDYGKAVDSPDDMEGIYIAHMRRKDAYDTAARKMRDSLRAMAGKAESDRDMRQPAAEDNIVDVEERIQEILDRDSQGDKYSKANEIITILYDVDIHHAVQSEEERRKLHWSGFGSLGIIADTARTDLLNKSQIEPWTEYLLKRELGRYHIKLLDRREVEALPEVERLRRQNRTLQHMYGEAKAAIERYEEEHEGPDCAACDGQDAGQGSLEEARGLLADGSLGLAGLLCRMRYEDSSCSLCHILQLPEHGCLQAYATCRHCMDAYLARHYGVEQCDTPTGFPPRYTLEDAVNDSQ